MGLRPGRLHAHSVEGLKGIHESKRFLRSGHRKSISEIHIENRCRKSRRKTRRENRGSEAPYFAILSPDFVYSVSRDFAKSCQTPMLVLPDDVTAHPLQVSIDIASLAPNAEITVFPWKDSPELEGTHDQPRAHLPEAAPAGVSAIDCRQRLTSPVRSRSSR
jgi:hypothetical protein